MDIVTHLAICASQDWGRVDRIAVGNFVTASQAQRKWYTKIIGKISSGDYRLGANSANIIVQNRMTGQLEEEKMQVYVRLGIRLLYKGAKRQMEGGRTRGLLKSLSIKQGPKYDAPQSAADVPGFIEFHNLKVDEISNLLDSFSETQKVCSTYRAAQQPLPCSVRVSRLHSSVPAVQAEKKYVAACLYIALPGTAFQMEDPDRLMLSRWDEQVIT
ncbi:hypothetical protein BDN71DRAFT_1497355 [Pleurotus eryngii]|uniref:Uncharacterized protein n=1 Tax=Pleurotus eryngii TaxID=5323 RepID=A0A9P6DDE0_PLEER|nr:hypothetical protein BDN71DRAFT_1497355 [Pleurotus eryngii]